MSSESQSGWSTRAARVLAHAGGTVSNPSLYVAEVADRCVGMNDAKLKTVATQRRNCGNALRRFLTRYEIAFEL